MINKQIIIDKKLYVDVATASEKTGIPFTKLMSMKKVLRRTGKKEITAAIKFTKKFKIELGESNE